jgi:hypothetical protein
VPFQVRAHLNPVNRRKDPDGLELDAEGAFVYALEKARAENAMNFDRSSDDIACIRIEIGIRLLWSAGVPGVLALHTSGVERAAEELLFE